MLIKSGLITQGSGSLGGLTASHNRGGLYLRARVIPTDPNSSFQAALRSILASLAGLWLSALSQAERDAWGVYADNVTVLNPLGDPIKLSGQQHYIRSNTPRLQIGAPRVDAGPTTYDLGSFTPLTVTSIAAPLVWTVGFDNTDDWANEDDSHAILFGSRGQNATINFFRGPYRQSAQIDGDSVTPPTSPIIVAAPFTLTAGQRFFSRARVSRADGRLSNQQFIGPDTVT